MSSGDPLPLGIHGRIASTALESHAPKRENGSPTLLYRRIASTFGYDYVPDQATSKAAERLVYRFAMQSAAREILPRECVSECMRGVIPGAEMGVNVLFAPAVNRAHFGGLKCCKSVWHCPVCAAKISERRREELTQATRSWPGCMLLVTYTLQHELANPLSEVLAALTTSRRLLVSGRAASQFNASYGIVGMVRSLELTYGGCGWHPHMHCLIFLESKVPLLAFEHDLKSRWAAAVAKTGKYASWANGCDVRYSDSEIAEYIAKFGREPKWTAAHELAKAVTKRGRRGGRTPLELLSEYMSGNKVAGRLWLQYAVVMKGQRQLWWSHGLRAKLGLDQEQTDEEIAVEQEEIAVLLSSLSVGAWRAVLANDARAELLYAASTGDADQVSRYLVKLGIKG